MSKAQPRLGSNELKSIKHISFMEKLKDEAREESAKILFFLVIAETISYLIGRLVLGMGSDEKYSVLMVYTITCIVLLSGAWRSYRQEKGALLLSQEDDPKCRVRRNGKWKEISKNHIECGDEILLQAGDRIPADGFLIDGSIRVNQSSINGRSTEEVEKRVVEDVYELEEDELLSGAYKCFRESFIISGTAIMRVTEVGKETLVGRKNISIKREGNSPGDEKTKRIFKMVSMFGYFGGAFVAIRSLALGILEIVRTGNITVGAIAFTVLNALMLGVSIIVMAVPEGLPLIGGLIQSLNVRKMRDDNIYVRNPKAVETAGYVTRIFMNKTGIFTTGKMLVSNVITGNGQAYTKFMNMSKILRENLAIGAGVNNEALIDTDGKAMGSNEIDRALLQYFIDNNVEISRSNIKEKQGFDSIAKYTAITLADGTQYIKGAAKVVLENCDAFLDNDGKEYVFTVNVREGLDKALRIQAARAMKVIAVAKTYKGHKTFIALISIRDDVNDYAPKALERLKKAGIKVTMVTGDGITTAKSVAYSTGLIGEYGDICITHDELAKMTDEEVIKILPNLKIVARAEPQDKERLIKLSKNLNEVVGITGNNVKDVAVLNKADVSFAINSATEFAKDVADIIVLNDNLNTIGNIIRYGRTTAKTVKKFIVFQLTVNVSSVITAIVGPFLGSGEVFTIVQMLWINMVMDVLAAMAFAQEPSQEAYMLEKPIPRTADIINTYVKTAVAVCGVFITVVCLAILKNVGGIHNIINSNDEIVIKTFMFATFIFLIIMNSLNARTQKLNLFENIIQNRNFILVMSFVAIMQIAIIQFGGKIFGTTPLSLHHWLYVILISLVIIPADFIRKIIVSKMGINE